MRREIIALVIVSLVLKLLLMPLNTYPTGDSVVHHLLALSIGTDSPHTTNYIDNFWTGYAFPFPEHYRPPLFHSTVGVVMLILNSDSFLIGQAVNILFSVLLIPMTYLLAKDYLKEEKALVAAALVAFSPFIIKFGIESEPRMMLAFFVLLSFYYAKRTNWFNFGVAGALAYLTHYTAALYLLAIFIVTFPEWRKKELKGIAGIILAGFMILTLSSPWLCRNCQAFGSCFYSTSTHVPFMKDVEHFYTLTPPDAGVYMSGEFVAIVTRVINITATVIPLKFDISVLYLTLLGMLSPVIYFFALREGLEMIIKKERLFWLIIIPLVISASIFGYVKSTGSATEALVPLIPIITILALRRMSEGWIQIAFVAITIQLIFIVLISFAPSPHYPAFEEGATVMSRDAHRVVFTNDGVRGVITPLANTSEICRIAQEYDVTHYWESWADTWLRNFTPEECFNCPTESRRSVNAIWLRGEKQEKICER